ncbi:MAG: phosphotransferase [Acidimicrobiia bacterium]
MIDGLTGYARENWPFWFGHFPESVGIAIGSGGPAHRTRAAVFVFEGRRRRPTAVMKIAFTELEAGFLRHEHDALTEIRALLPGPMRPSVPQALGLAEIGGNTVLTMEALAGRRLLVPDLNGSGGSLPRSLMGDFYRKSFAWSNDLAVATSSSERLDGSHLAEVVDRYIVLAPLSAEAGGRLRSFRGALAESGVTWSTSWQHADLAVGNVLMHRGNLRLLDWEHASDRSQPWFDLAHSVGATSRLAKRQSGAASSRFAAMSALGRSGWAGPVLREELERSWDNRMPLGWVIALSSMATAIRQAEDARMGADDWTEFAAALVADDELRFELPWMVPDW